MEEEDCMEGLEDIENWDEVDESTAWREDDYLKGLEDIDWSEDWDELEQLCSSDSLCCIARSEDLHSRSLVEPDITSDAHQTEPKWSTVSLPGDITSDAHQTEPERSTISLPRRSSARFARNITNEAVETAIAERVPKNTVKSTIWGLKVFDSWCLEREIRSSVTSMTATELNNYVARFVHEAVKQDGCTPYPPNSLYQIVVAIQRFLRENGRPEVCFFDENCSTYDKLRKSLDARMKELAKDGYGTERKCADPINRQMECKLWDSGVFSRETSVGLLNIVYFYNCKLFGLRAGDEHRSLCVNQFCFGVSNECEYVQFNGRTSKTYHGGLKHKKLVPKELRIYSMPELGDRDIVACYKCYLSLIPSEGPFYRKPSKHMSSIQPSFTKQVVGKNTLNGLVPKICSEAGLEGNFTGHSGKVTCATELFNNMIDEQLIQMQTGHRSTSGVRYYKRPSDDHFKNVSKILQPPPSKKSPCNDVTTIENINPSPNIVTENVTKKVS